MRDLTIIACCIVAVAAYMLPTIIAAANRHRNANAIGALNLLLGWTFVGWVAAMVWAHTDNRGDPR